MKTMKTDATGATLLRALAKTNCDVSEALTTIRLAELRGQTAEADRAHEILAILVSPRPPRWPWRRPRYSRVDATIASRTIANCAAAAIRRRYGHIKFDPIARQRSSIQRFYPGSFELPAVPRARMMN